MNYKKKIMQATKLEVKEFWDKKPCGTAGTAPLNPDKGYFDSIRERRYELEPFILDVIRQSKLAGKKVLEIGCGVGTDGISLVENGAQYTGVDLSTHSLELARKNFTLHGVRGELKEADAERLPFGDGSFDFVYSWGVLHHSPDLKQTIGEVRRVLKPGGYFAIMLYNRRSLVALQLLLVYGLFKFKPAISLHKLFAEHHESPGTKAITDAEARDLFRDFSEVEIKNIVTPYDVRLTRNKFLPSIFQKLVPSRLGFFKLITGKKPLE
jgi:ubiquinone/menaquinone biosynthesis C-methylase UbiE